MSNRTPDNKLYLVSSNDWNLPQTENAYRWFLEKLTFLLDEEPAASETVAQIASGDDRKARILKELLLADLGITDVVIKNSQGKIPVITTTHRIMNEDGTIEYFQLLMEQESVGTQHFFARIGGWLQALENGALLVVDEIEDSLHPLLTRRLIEMVQDKTINTKGAQLIFTTHDAMLLDLNFSAGIRSGLPKRMTGLVQQSFTPLLLSHQEKGKMCVRVISREDLVRFLLSEVTPNE